MPLRRARFPQRGGDLARACGPCCGGRPTPACGFTNRRAPVLSGRSANRLCGTGAQAERQVDISPICRHHTAQYISRWRSLDGRDRSDRRRRSNRPGNSQAKGPSRGLNLESDAARVRRRDNVLRHQYRWGARASQTRRERPMVRFDRDAFVLSAAARAGAPRRARRPAPRTHAAPAPGRTTGAPFFTPSEE